MYDVLDQTAQRYKLATTRAKFDCWDCHIAKAFEETRRQVPFQLVSLQSWILSQPKNSMRSEVGELSFDFSAASDSITNPLSYFSARGLEAA